jgi:hypothetical protein
MTNKHQVDELVFTHEMLWRSSHALEKHLKSAPDDRNLLIPALLTTFLAYEAFVNFCGFALRPDLWENERDNFRNIGLEGKLEKIVEKVPHFTWDKGRKPYQTIKKMQRFRDIATHGKVQRNEYITTDQPNGKHFCFQHDWDVFLTSNNFMNARRDVKQFCQTLVEAIRDLVEQDMFLDDDIHDHFIFDAFEGPLASGSGHQLP